MTKTVSKTYREYSEQEEWVNIVTHAIGIVLGISSFVLFMLKGIEEQRTVAYFITLSIYCLTFSWTYITSTVYHSLFRASISLKNKAHLLDHTAIYLFIAGTYTPVAYFFLPGNWSIAILVLIWLFALAGVIFKLYSIGKWNKLSTYLYLTMGWLIVVAAKPLIETAPNELLYLIALGGICYSIGTIFFLMNGLKHAHGIWHLFVLAGSVAHLVGIYSFI
jgi:hemolysin III